MRDREKCIPPVPPAPSEPLDLTRYSEAARREIYNRIAAEHFAPELMSIREVRARADDFIETRTAEEAGLMVLFLLGRWFALWRLADPPEHPTEREFWELVTISEGPRGLTMAEV